MTASDLNPGRRQPPLEHRFKPGASGNPAGRPKRQTSTGESLAMVLEDTVCVTHNGRRRRMSAEEQRLRAMVIKAMKGDVRANRSISTIMAEGPDSKLARAQTPAKVDVRQVKKDLAFIAHIDEGDLDFLDKI